MKIFGKSLIRNILVVSFVFVLLGLIGPIAALAVTTATTPSLGVAATFGVLSDTFNNTSATTIINGDIGFTTFAGAAPGGVNTNFTPASSAGTAQAAALTALTSGVNATCDFTFAPGAIDLATDMTHVTAGWGSGIGVYYPGIYCTAGAASALSVGTAGITLTGAGTYIFRNDGTLDTVTGSSVTLNGASACDVFWNPNGATTLNHDSSFAGTVIPVLAAAHDITVYAGVTWVGRALTFAHTVTIPGADSSITVPNCAAPTLTVNKTINNTHGGTKLLTTDFSFFIDGSGVLSGVASTTSIGSHTVSETPDSGYTTLIGGDCLANGTITLTNGQNAICSITNNDIAPATSTLHIIKLVSGGAATSSDFTIGVTGTSVSTSSFAGSASGVDVTLDAGAYTVTETGTVANYSAATSTGCSGTITAGTTTTCTITNTYTAPVPPVHSSSGGYSPVPPLIDVVKVPSPLALPAGPGPVTYTYTVTNIGTVPMTGITLIDDKCSTTTLISGDTNGDAKLDVTETWIYRCSMTLSTTTTNTVVATGWANGLSSIDIANAIVVVGLPVVPPLIHVTKIPSPLTLFSGAGLVTYTERITNPGTVALSNVILTDDKCSPMKYISGDTNGDSKLDTTETWLYTCAINLATTTTNTAVATGEANGLTAKDFAIATVIVTSPSLPNTGLGTTWSIVLFAGLITLVLISLIVVLRRKMM